MSPMTSAGKRSGEGYVDTLGDWGCRLSTGVSMRELEEKRLLRELRRKLPKLSRETIMCLLSLFQSNSTIGRTLLPAEVSKGLKIKSTNYSSITIWGTYIRWASLCPYASYLVLSGRVPLETSTPPIVNELKVLHDKIVDIVWYALCNLMRRPTPKIILAYNFTYEKGRGFEYSLFLREEKLVYNIVVKPDIYVLLNIGNGRVANLLVEVTLRSRRTISKVWLASYMLGAYLQNLQPTAVMLVTPEEVKALLLSQQLLRELLILLKGKQHRRERVEKWLCNNCDLRPLCSFKED